MRKLLLALVTLGALGLALGAWLAFAPNTPDFEGTRSVRIPPGTSFDATVELMEYEGLVDSRTSLTTFGTLTGWRRQVKPGHYAFEAGASNWDLLDKIRKGLQDPIRVTIPPGTRPEVLAAVLRRDLGTDSAAVRQALRDPALAADLGTDTLHLFGHMRANSFDIFWTTDAETALRRIHAWYDRFWTDEREAQAEALGLTPDEVITLASIVEWEARVPEERPRIAGVYLNRLLGRTNAGRMRLQADPTVQYALMQADGGPMRRLLRDDYRFAHPYNTYTNDGLPPGPVTNPSESSIDAVLNAEDHDFLYFVAEPGGTGRHRFSRTLRDHNASADAWSAWLSEQVRIRQQREDSLRQDSLRRARESVTL
ncbi:MAG: endolytic transglycosylase MltG [Rhodothermaceae bacterium]|nr:endolytic transglycosylase MltG [Rhodothermaceae bacterium]